LKNLPLIQPVASVSQGHSVLTSISFVILIQKEPDKNKIKPIILKPKFDPSKKPYPNNDKEEQIIIKGCEEEKSIDCLYSEINSFIKENINPKTKNKLKGKRFYLEISISDKGDFVGDDLKCSLEDYQKYFKKMFSKLSIKEPAKINGNNTKMTYSIPIEM